MLLLLASILPAVSAVYHGFNIRGNNPDGSCRSQADWEAEMKLVKQFGGNSVKLFSTSQCNSKRNAGFS